MGCAKGLCTAEKIFIFINIAFASFDCSIIISVLLRSSAGFSRGESTGGGEVLRLSPAQGAQVPQEADKMFRAECVRVSGGGRRASRSWRTRRAPAAARRTTADNPSYVSLASIQRLAFVGVCTERACEYVGSQQPALSGSIARRLTAGAAGINSGGSPRPVAAARGDTAPPVPKPLSCWLIGMARRWPRTQRAFSRAQAGSVSPAPALLPGDPPRGPAKMYSGALLATAARLAWDPSTYTWFRFLCAAQYRVSAAYVFAAGVWLAALVYLAAAAAQRHAPLCLHLYAAGVACLALSEVGYGAWMGASLAAWWREAPQAELARRGMDLLHDLKPALLAVERYRDVARPLYDMIEEVEREAPNNAFVIIVFGVLGMVLQARVFILIIKNLYIAAFIMARRLARGPGSRAGSVSDDKHAAVRAVPAHDDDSDTNDPERAPPGWRKKANLRMTRQAGARPPRRRQRWRRATRRGRRCRRSSRRSAPRAAPSAPSAALLILREPPRHPHRPRHAPAAAPGATYYTREASRSAPDAGLLDLVTCGARCTQVAGGVQRARRGDGCSVVASVLRASVVALFCLLALVVAVAMCSRFAPAALAHVNLLLTLYGGALLATAARLKWDPSTYIVVRELFPAEYRAAGITLAGAGALLLLLAHAAAAALHAQRERNRRVLLYTYAVFMTLLMVGELVFGTWLALQVVAWLDSEAAQQMGEALELSEHLRPVLRYLARWHPLPDRIDALIAEAAADAPRNLYAALALGALLMVLQPLSVALALVTACPRRAPTSSETSLQPRNSLYRYAFTDHSTDYNYVREDPKPYINIRKTSGRRARPPSSLADVFVMCSRADSGPQYQPLPLRTAYKNGRIVIL
ncbi:unnamed protein product [Chrysodeixis includens]|uniref:Uncharacterized protein n=1 Tax=Chrysodeixis includens TaxID=689277 RepID=A0A9N8Q0Z8_CHRIL|nr:unnamed protein product [Chrysodeixis includens]